MVATRRLRTLLFVIFLVSFDVFGAVIGICLTVSCAKRFDTSVSYVLFGAGVSSERRSVTSAMMMEAFTISKAFIVDMVIFVIGIGSILTMLAIRMIEDYKVLAELIAITTRAPITTKSVLTGGVVLVLTTRNREGNGLPPIVRIVETAVLRNGISDV